MLAESLENTHRIAVGTFTWRGKTTPIAIRRHQGGLLLQRLFFADEVHKASEIDRGAGPKIPDQERTLAERLITELSSSEFQPENYEDAYRKRLLKAIEQKVAGEEIAAAAQSQPVSRPLPDPTSAQRAHSQGGRTLACGRPARQGPARAGTDSGRRRCEPAPTGRRADWDGGGARDRRRVTGR